MKIGIVTNAFYPQSYAAPQRVSHLTKELIKRGHEVFIFTNYPDAKKNVNSKRLHIYHIDVHASIFPFVAKIKFWGILKKLDYLFATSSNYFNGIFLALNRGIKWKHFDIRDSPYLGWQIKERPRWLNDIYFLLGKLALANSDKASALTNGLAGCFKKYQGSIRILPNGGDGNLFKSLTKYKIAKYKIGNGFSKNDKIIGYFGSIRLDENPGDVSKYIEKNINNYKFLIVGDGPYRFTYDKLAEKYPERIFVLGSVSHEKVAELLPICDKTIAFDYPVKHRTCAIPLKIYESICAGVPIVYNLKRTETANVIKKYSLDKKSGCLKNRNEFTWETRASRLADYIEESFN